MTWSNRAETNPQCTWAVKRKTFVVVVQHSETKFKLPASRKWRFARVTAQMAPQQVAASF